MAHARNPDMEILWFVPTVNWGKNIHCGGSTDFFGFWEALLIGRNPW